MQRAIQNGDKETGELHEAYWSNGCRANIQTIEKNRSMEKIFQRNNAH